MRRLIYLVLLFSINANAQTNILDSNIRAQTANQLSQANYYSRLEATKDTTWISVVSVLLAGLLSFSSAAYVTIKSLENEKQKNFVLQKREFERESRLAASDLVSKTSQALHSITWVCWIARFTPENFTNQLIYEHDKKMYTLYPEIIAAQVILAARNKELYESTIDIVEALHEYDGNLSGITAGLYSGKKDETINEIGEMWEDVYNYLKNIPANFSSKIEAILLKKQQNKL